MNTIMVGKNVIIFLSTVKVRRLLVFCMIYFQYILADKTIEVISVIRLNTSSVMSIGGQM